MTREECAKLNVHDLITIEGYTGEYEISKITVDSSCLWFTVRSLENLGHEFFLSPQYSKMAFLQKMRKVKRK